MLSKNCLNNYTDVIIKLTIGTRGGPLDKFLIELVDFGGMLLYNSLHGLSVGERCIIVFRFYLLNPWEMFLLLVDTGP